MDPDDLVDAFLRDIEGVAPVKQKGPLVRAPYPDAVKRTLGPKPSLFSGGIRPSAIGASRIDRRAYDAASEDLGKLGKERYSADTQRSDDVADLDARRTRLERERGPLQALIDNDEAGQGAAAKRIKEIDEELKLNSTARRNAVLAQSGGPTVEAADRQARSSAARLGSGSQRLADRRLAAEVARADRLANVKGIARRGVAGLALAAAAAGGIALHRARSREAAERFADVYPRFLDGEDLSAGDLAVIQDRLGDEVFFEMMETGRAAREAGAPIGGAVADEMRGAAEEEALFEMEERAEGVDGQDMLGPRRDLVPLEGDQSSNPTLRPGFPLVSPPAAVDPAAGRGDGGPERLINAASLENDALDDLLMRFDLPPMSEEDFLASVTPPADQVADLNAPDISDPEGFGAGMSRVDRANFPEIFGSRSAPVAPSTFDPGEFNDIVSEEGREAGMKYLLDTEVQNIINQGGADIDTRLLERAEILGLPSWATDAVARLGANARGTGTEPTIPRNGLVRGADFLLDMGGFRDRVDDGFDWRQPIDYPLHALDFLLPESVNGGVDGTYGAIREPLALAGALPGGGIALTDTPAAEQPRRAGGDFGSLDEVRNYQAATDGADPTFTGARGIAPFTMTQVIDMSENDPGRLQALYDSGLITPEQMEIIQNSPASSARGAVESGAISNLFSPEAAPDNIAAEMSSPLPQGGDLGAPVMPQGAPGPSPDRAPRVMDEAPQMGRDDEEMQRVIDQIINQDEVLRPVGQVPQRRGEAEDSTTEARAGEYGPFGNLFGSMANAQVGEMGDTSALVPPGQSPEVNIPRDAMLSWEGDAFSDEPAALQSAPDASAVAQPQAEGLSFGMGEGVGVASTGPLPFPDGNGAQMGGNSRAAAQKSGAVGDFNASRGQEADDDLNWINSFMRDTLGLDADARERAAKALAGFGAGMLSSNGDFGQMLGAGMQGGIEGFESERAYQDAEEQEAHARMLAKQKLAQARARGASTEELRRLEAEVRMVELEARLAEARRVPEAPGDIPEVEALAARIFDEGRGGITYQEAFNQAMAIVYDNLALGMQ